MMSTRCRDGILAKILPKRRGFSLFSPYVMNRESPPSVFVLEGEEERRLAIKHRGGGDISPKTLYR
jgi:hypothetical protein